MLLDDGVHRTPDYKGMIDGFRWAREREGLWPVEVALLCIDVESWADASGVFFRWEETD